MDVSGVCTAGRPQWGGEEAGMDEAVVVEHDVNHGVLQMRAMRVRCEADLDSASLLRVSLPMPFGRELLLAPVEWQWSNGALSAEKLKDLLSKLREDVRRTSMGTQSVLLRPTTHDEDEEEGVGLLTDLQEEDSDDEGPIAEDDEIEDELDEEGEEEEDDAEFEQGDGAEEEDAAEDDFHDR